MIRFPTSRPRASSTALGRRCTLPPACRRGPTSSPKRRSSAIASWRAASRCLPCSYLIGVEAIGKGEEFYSLLLRNTKLPILACQTGRKSKGERFEKQMAPLFEYNRAWISDAANEFIKHFISEWTLWPLGEHDDTLDAVYYALAVSQDSLAPPRKRSTLPQP